jgi:hypothetical protein
MSSAKIRGEILGIPEKRQGSGRRNPIPTLGPLMVFPEKG